MTLPSFDVSKLAYLPARVYTYPQNGVRPILLEMDLTLSCNLHCPHCVFKEALAPVSIPPDRAKQIIYAARDLGVTALRLSGGGEPCTYPHLSEIIVTAHHSGLKVGLVTNGTRIDLPLARAITEYCTWCRVSLDASTPSQYSTVHGCREAEWFNALQGLRNLTSYQSDCTIGIGYLVSDPADVAPIYPIADALHVDYVQFRPYRGQETDLRSQITVPPTTRTPILFSDYRFRAMSLPRTYDHCRAAPFCITVGADSHLYPCCELKYTTFKLGDLSQAPLPEVWRTTAYPRLIRQKVTPFCPYPCRHDANNRYLSRLATEDPHRQFI